ncbi:MAG: sugar phosphate isomerase/epimerase [bacterium]|nr:sugar phosphate isomerase/epimerase [bacterium]
MSLPIVLHVNYCEQGQTIPEMCQKAVDWGYDGIEFRRYRRGMDETPEQYVDSIAASAQKSGLKYVLFGGPGIELMTGDADARKAQVEEGVQFYRLAADRVNLTVCNIMAGSLRSSDPNVGGGDYHKHGSAAAEEKHYTQAAEGFKVLGGVAEELGFKLAFEIHMGYVHDLPDPTMKLLGMIGSPAVGANLDYGNMVYFPKAPSLSETISTLSEKLYMVHLKNSMPAGTGRNAVGLGDGIINHREYLSLLKQSGFSGPICIEAPRPGDREWFAQQDIAYLKSVLKDLDW